MTSRSLHQVPVNLVPRVLWLFGQRMGASRDSGVLEFCYRKISAVKQWKSRSPKSQRTLGTRLGSGKIHFFSFTKTFLINSQAGNVENFNKKF